MPKMPMIHWNTLIAATVVVLALIGIYHLAHKH